MALPARRPSAWHTICTAITSPAVIAGGHAHGLPDGLCEPAHFTPNPTGEHPAHPRAEDPPPHKANACCAPGAGHPKLILCLQHVPQRDVMYPPPSRTTPKGCGVLCEGLSAPFTPSARATWQTVNEPHGACFLPKPDEPLTCDTEDRLCCPHMRRAPGKHTLLG